MTKEDVIRMAREAWLSDKEAQLITEFDEAYISCTYLQDLQKFAALVAEHERNQIANEWWSCYQSDLENGVKSLNEYEAMKFFTNYPELAKFGKWIDARGQA